jgi:hypothetical protein
LAELKLNRIFKSKTKLKWLIVTYLCALLFTPIIGLAQKLDANQLAIDKAQATIPTKIKRFFDLATV